MDDVWVCSACKSVNRRRDDRCYSCRAPREQELRPVEGPSPRLTSAVINRTVRSYLPSWPVAIIAGALILAVSGIGVILLLDQLTRFPAIKEAVVEAARRSPADADAAFTQANLGLAGLAIVQLGLSALGLLAFATWLALVTLNVPALGGGMPTRGPVRTFVYALIPIFNLYRVPAMIQDVFYRLDATGGGFFLVMAAWLGLVGSRFVGYFGQWFITLGIADEVTYARTTADFAAIVDHILDQSLILGSIVELMAAAGAFLLVVLMARIERRCALRDREIKAAIAAG